MKGQIVDNLDKIKFAARLIVGISSSYVAANVIKNNTNPKNKLQQAEVVVGGLVIGNMVAAQAELHTDRFIDSIADRVKASQTSK